MATERASEARRLLPLHGVGLGFLTLPRRNERADDGAHASLASL